MASVIERLRELASAYTPDDKWYFAGELTEEEAGVSGGRPATIVIAEQDEEGANPKDILPDLDCYDLEFCVMAQNYMMTFIALVEAVESKDQSRIESALAELKKEAQ